MKKIFVIAAMATALAATAAVPRDFTVSAPKFNKVVRSIAEDGVNIRKAPSTTAPKAVYNESKIEDYEAPVQTYTYWSTGKTGGSIYADKFQGPAPLVSESDGWFEVYGIGPANDAFHNGWVSAKFCTASDVVPITSQTVADYATELRSLGNGLMIYYVADPMNGECSFYVGRLAGGQLVCPYLLYAVAIEETSGKTTFRKNEYGAQIIYCNPSEKDIEGPLLEKLTDSTLQLILQQAEKTDRPITVFFDGNSLSSY